MNNSSHGVSQTISLFYQNARGLRTKMEAFFKKVSASNYDIIVITETWLSANQFSSEIFPKSYSVTRFDRTTSIGGGVLIATNSEKLKSEQISLAEYQDIEAVCIKITGKRKGVFIYAFYIPPNSCMEKYQSHMDAIESIALYTMDALVVIGDANIPKVNWTSDLRNPKAFFPSENMGNNAKDFLSFFLCKNMFQIIDKRNCSGNVLDLCYTNEPEGVIINYDCNPLSSPVDPHHCHFELSMEIDVIERRNRAFQYTLNYNKANFEQIAESIGELNIENLVNAANVDRAFEEFYDEMQRIIDANVPRMKKFVSKGVPWEHNSELRNLKNRIRKMKKKRNGPGGELFIDECNQLCQQYDELYAALYDEYVGNLQAQFKLNPKKFWEFVSSKRAVENLPDLLRWNETEAKSDEEIANLFASYFHSVFIEPESNSMDHSLIDRCLVDDSDIVLSIDDIRGAIKSIDVSKSSGPDIIAPIIFKNCEESFVSVLHALFSKSLREGVFPACLKKVYVRPIFKKGDKANVENYRSVSLAATTSKLFERLMLNKWNEKIFRHISPAQHGFVKGKSTVTNLMVMTSDIVDNFVDKAPTHVIFTDFQKAFDSTDHCILVRKFAEYGFDGRIVKWLWSFLTSRINIVKINGYESGGFSPMSGVPAGCILSATLFLIFINDITVGLNDVKVLMYADDLKIYGKIESISDVAKMQVALNIIEQWCVRNRLKMNVEKLKYIICDRAKKGLLAATTSYSFGGHPIQRVDAHRDLGVILDCELNFKNHTSQMIRKAYIALGFIRRFAMNMFDKHCVKTLYCALVRSQLEYASQIWNPLYAITAIEIEKIQKRFTIYALRCRRDPISHKYPSYKSRCEQLKLETLSRRRRNVEIFLMYDIITEKINVLELSNRIQFNRPSRTTRHAEFLRVKAFRVNYAFNAPMNRMAILFNKIYAYFRDCISRNGFRNTIKKLDDQFII